MRSLEDVGVDDESSNISSDSLLSSAVEKMIEDMQLEDTFDDEPAPHTNEDEALRLLSPIKPQLPTTSEQAAPFVPRRPAWMLAQGVRGLCATSGT